jgi:hypothetical protein
MSVLFYCISPNGNIAIKGDVDQNSFYIIDSENATASDEYKTLTEAVSAYDRTAMDFLMPTPAAITLLEQERRLSISNALP